MIFNSILFPQDYKAALQTEEPGFFADLNLNQVVNSIVSGKEEYNLKPFFYTSLTDIDAINYRQEVMQDLENTDVFEQVKLFAENMRLIRQRLSKTEKLYHKNHKTRSFLDVVQIYCKTLHSLLSNLSDLQLKSVGLIAFKEYLNEYLLSDYFSYLANTSTSLIQKLSTVRYCVNLKDLRVQVRNYASESDYTSEMEVLFEKFRQGDVKDYRITFPEITNMNDVEARILEGVAQLYPDYFSELDTFYEKNTRFQDEKITVFDREIQFYIAYLDYITGIKAVGLKFCYPVMSSSEKEIFNNESFDLNLAHKLVQEKSTVIVNDFYLREKERIFVVSGPNQGGKTTFARTFGQVHYLAELGCPIPGKEAKLFLYDQLFTHFEKEENIQNLRSKFEDDLFRIYSILNQATPNSIVILNEILSSTTLQDAIFLSKKIMDKIIQMDLFCVWVTFIDELAAYSEKTVSMVSTVVPENPAVRTYKMVRKPANGLAYSISIAEKYQLTYESLNKRIKA